MNKVLLTYVSSALSLAVGMVINEPWGSVFLSAGLFALSGAVTNALAIHMLFERVPGFYGSGVIASQFEEFKAGIRTMIMEQFFKPENLARFFNDGIAGQGRLTESLSTFVADLDYDKAFDALTGTIAQSSLGSMLNLMGGVKALEGLRKPFAEQMQNYLIGVVNSGDVERMLASNMALATSTDTVQARIEGLVDARLDELSPEQVKNIIQRMIRRHLGWLVVWGGVVGGMMGAVFSIPLNW